MEDKTFKHKLAVLIVEKKIKQGELAIFLGVNKSTITNYKSGYSMPSFEIIKKICDYAGVGIEYFGEQTSSSILHEQQSEYITTNKCKEELEKAKQEIYLLNKMLNEANSERYKYKQLYEDEARAHEIITPAISQHVRESK